MQGMIDMKLDNVWGEGWKCLKWAGQMITLGICIKELQCIVIM